MAALAPLGPPKSPSLAKGAGKVTLERNCSQERLTCSQPFPWSPLSGASGALHVRACPQPISTAFSPLPFAPESRYRSNLRQHRQVRPLPQSTLKAEMLLLAVSQPKLPTPPLLSHFFPYLPKEGGWKKFPTDDQCEVFTCKVSRTGCHSLARERGLLTMFSPVVLNLTAVPQNGNHWALRSTKPGSVT